jgi:transcriptional regulator with GAF, ATPase, and Fis domain
MRCVIHENAAFCRMHLLSREIWDFTLQATRPHFVYRDAPDKIIRALSDIVGLTTNHDLALPLLMDEEPIGLLVLRTKGHDRFTGEHAELLSFVAQPFSIALSNALAYDRVVRYRDLLIDDNRFLTRELLNELPENIIGANGGLHQVMQAVDQVAPLSNLVLILGETGVGKEVIANTIHYSSSRSKQPFIKVNWGPYPSI